MRGRLPLPFEVDLCPGGVGTIHSHCQVVVISEGLCKVFKRLWPNVSYSNWT